jgi:hypothetical protein
VISKALLVISALAMASSLLLSTVGVESTMAEELILVTSARVSTNEKIPVVVWRNFIFEGAEDVTNV